MQELLQLIIIFLLTLCLMVLLAIFSCVVSGIINFIEICLQDRKTPKYIYIDREVVVYKDKKKGRDSSNDHLIPLLQSAGFKKSDSQKILEHRNEFKTEDEFLAAAITGKIFWQ